MALPNAPPFANRPDRAVEHGGNLIIRLPGARKLQNCHTLFKGGRVCTMCHNSPSFLAVNRDAWGYTINSVHLEDDVVHQAAITSCLTNHRIPLAKSGQAARAAKREVRVLA